VTVTVLDAAIIVAAGVFAGAINTVVGSGTLVTFPVLLALGYPPITANVSNTLGLVPGSVSGAIGYRRELRGQRDRLVRLGACSACGGLVGAVLLLVLPAGAFKAIVPALIGLGLVLVVTQPFLARRLAARDRPRHPHGGVLLYLGVFLTGVYGGYFGAAQGVLLLGLMGILIDDTLQRINATKNVLAALVNLVAGILFAFVAHVAWWVVLLLAVGSLAGGQVGAKVGRRLPPWGLRGVIVVVGLVALAKLLL
jgi:uncharacterized membrane protein YfcA